MINKGYEHNKKKSEACSRCRFSRNKEIFAQVFISSIGNSKTIEEARVSAHKSDLSADKYVYLDCRGMKKGIYEIKRKLLFTVDVSIQLSQVGKRSVVSTKLVKEAEIIEAPTTLQVVPRKRLLAPKFGDDTDTQAVHGETVKLTRKSSL